MKAKENYDYDNDDLSLNSVLENGRKYYYGFIRNWPQTEYVTLVKRKWWDKFFKSTILPGKCVTEK